MYLLCLRHGESVGNREGRLQGSREYPLTPTGDVQAALAGRFLASLPQRPAAIFHSPLQRTLQTAVRVASAYPEPVRLVPVEALRELHAGRLEGETWEALKQADPPFYGRPQSQWLDYSPWGGERQAEVFPRIHGWLDELTAGWDLASPQAVLLVAHALTIRAAIGWVLDDRGGSHLQYHLGNCTLVICHLRPGPGGLRRTIEALLPLEQQARMLGEAVPGSEAAGL